MRVIDSSRTPEQWLSSIGVPPAEIPGIMRTYLHRPVVCIYRPPHVFLRAHGRSAVKRIYDPNYWADGTALATAYERAEQFSQFLSDEEISRIAKNNYREVTAISHNWNDLNSNTFWKISLRGGEVLEGIEGPACSQPTFSADPRTGAMASNSRLSGGGIQVYLNPETPFICTPVNWS